MDERTGHKRRVQHLARWTALAAAAALALGGCAVFHHDDDATVGVNAVHSVPGSVVAGGGTKGTLTGASVGGVIGHEAAPRP
jgi:osmotically inducible lipoprotein OsmB